MCVHVRACGHGRRSPQAIDTESGSVVWNLDTLDLLPGQQYAFTAGMACF